MPYVICSPSTEIYAKQIALNLHSTKIIVVNGRLRDDVKYGTFDDVVIGIGGGSVIDYAKIVSGKRTSIAVPTTASGANMTSHAVVWGEEKKDIETRIPLTLPLYELWNIKLSEEVLDDTFIDCICHCFETLLNENAGKVSSNYARKGLKYLGLFLDTKFINYLIKAGNYGGQAIELIPTSIIHKPSYEYTLRGLSHGRALKKVLIDKGYSSCLNRRNLYTDIVQSPLISYTLDI